MSIKDTEAGIEELLSGLDDNDLIKVKYLKEVINEHRKKTLNEQREAAGLPPINTHVGNRDLQEIASELHKLNNNIGMLIKAVKTRK